MSYRTRPDIALRTESSCRNKPGVNVFATITALCLNLCMSQVQEKRCSISSNQVKFQTIVTAATSIRFTDKMLVPVKTGIGDRCHPAENISTCCSIWKLSTLLYRPQNVPIECCNISGLSLYLIGEL